MSVQMFQVLPLGLKVETVGITASRSPPLAEQETRPLQLRGDNSPAIA